MEKRFMVDRICKRVGKEKEAKRVPQTKEQNQRVGRRVSQKSV